MRTHSLLLLLLLLFFCLGVSSYSTATERVQVDPYIKAGPGYTAATGSITGYVPSKSNSDLLLEAERKGWMGSSSAKTPITIKPKVSIPVGGIAGKLKTGLKTNLGQVALGVAISGAIAGVDWVMNEGTLVKKKPASIPYDSNYTYWELNFNANSKGASPSEACANAGMSAYVVKGTSSCDLYYPNSTTFWGNYPLKKIDKGCPGGSYYSTVTQSCAKDSYVPLQNSDYDALDPWISAQSADWLKGLLTEVCQGSFGSVNPQGCYDDLQRQSKAIISGPARVSGPSSTTTGTYTKPDGTTGSRTTTQNTNYNIRYGDNYFDYDTEINNKVTEDGQAVSDETTSDATDPAQDPEEKPEDEEEPERLVSGEECSQGLSCSGDAIDCASLRQEKAIRCSFDWPTQQSSVLSEVSKPEYDLQEKQIDASTLFTGPSAGRWIGGSCPADKVYYSTLAKRSFYFSWSFFCQFSTGISVMLIGMASLFFAVYVGRAFGGN